MVRPQTSAAVLVDELAPEGPPASPEQLVREPSTPPESPQSLVRGPREIEIRDERGERDQAVWILAIDRGLERYERDSVPFAVLLVELADVERLRHAELPGEMARLTGLVETALSGELRPADSLTRESPGRYWLLAAETDAGDARTLVARLGEAVRGAASHRGTPLEVAIGLAVCPADGDRAAALAAHAHIALYAARAAGRPVA
jgi:GGDEF domain-containing protein